MGIGIGGEDAGQLWREIVEVVGLRVLGEGPGGVVEVVEEAEELVCLGGGEELGRGRQRGRVGEEGGEIRVEGHKVKVVRRDGRRGHGGGREEETRQSAGRVAGRGLS
jgi:hypothetical protein